MDLSVSLNTLNGVTISTLYHAPVHRAGSLVWQYEKGSDTLPRMAHSPISEQGTGRAMLVTQLLCWSMKYYALPLLLCCIHHLQSNNETSLSVRLKFYFQLCPRHSNLSKSASNPILWTKGKRKDRFPCITSIGAVFFWLE